MSRLKKHRRAITRRIEAAAPAPAGQPAAYFSGYQGASFGTDRGMVWWPSTDSRQELDSFTRNELIRRIHWLKGNFGFIAGMISSSADLVGWQSPQAQSGDAAWDDLAEAAFRDVTGLAEAFDVAGKFDFEAAQPMLMRAALTDGQILTVLTKWPDGAARVAFYEASQLCNPDNATAEWHDGIRISKTGRHLAYGLRNGPAGTVTVIPARDVIYFGEFDAPRQIAPVPPLAHAVNHAIDITEVWGFTKKAIKNSSLSGAIIERDTNAIPPRGKMGMPGAMTTVTNSAGEKFQQANVWDGGQINSLDPGSKMKILHDTRPPQEQRNFTHDLKRDIAQGFGMPVEVYDDMGNLTGPGIRFVMDFAGNWIRCRQKRLKAWSARVWRYVIACEIAAGRLALPKPDPITGKQQWWAVSFTSQRLLTIDRGKESRARLEELNAGVSTLADWEEFDGRDWKDRGKQRIREVAFLKEECAAQGLEYAEVFPPRPGTAAAQPDNGQQSSATSEDEEDTTGSPLPDDQ